MGEGLAPDQAWWRGKSTKLGILRLGLNSSSATRSWAALGEIFLLSGFDQPRFQAGARAARDTWLGRRQRGEGYKLS